ncbi:hypothetical protein HDU98_003020, partial [Podochytrium sp. JEL0797]
MTLRIALHKMSPTASLTTFSETDSEKTDFASSPPMHVAKAFTAELMPVRIPSLPALSSFFVSPTSAVFAAAKSGCLRVLSNIQSGRITIIDASNDRSKASPDVYQFGEKNADTRATIRVLKPLFWLRLAVYSALGFGESFMYNEVEVDGLTNLII